MDECNITNINETKSQEVTCIKELLTQNDELKSLILKVIYLLLARSS